MAKRSEVDTLMSVQSVSRSVANNMIDLGISNVSEYRTYRKKIVAKRHKTTKTIRKHKTSRVKNATATPAKKK